THQTKFLLQRTKKNLLMGEQKKIMVLLSNNLAYSALIRCMMTASEGKIYTLQSLTVALPMQIQTRFFAKQTS
ncbi:MAG: hypothetical protein EAZ08_00025, partial [Cytophagales bacterium]